MILDEPTLLRAVNLAERGYSFEKIAKTLGTSHRLMYRWLERSRQHNQSFYLIGKRGPNWWHVLIEQARASARWMTDPELDDCSDEEIFDLFGLRDRFLRDENGKLIPRPDEPEPDMTDIDKLTAQAAAEPTREKARPNAPVAIGRVTESGPPERLTGASEQPRRGLPIEGAGRGLQAPATEGRFTIARHVTTLAQRRAGTISVSESGIKRW